MPVQDWVDAGGRKRDESVSWWRCSNEQRAASRAYNLGHSGISGFTVYSTVQYNTEQCSAVQCSTAPSGSTGILLGRVDLDMRLAERGEMSSGGSESVDVDVHGDKDEGISELQPDCRGGLHPVDWPCSAWQYFWFGWIRN